MKVTCVETLHEVHEHVDEIVHIVLSFLRVWLVSNEDDETEHLQHLTESSSGTILTDSEILLKQSLIQFVILWVLN